MRYIYINVNSVASLKNVTKINQFAKQNCAIITVCNSSILTMLLAFGMVVFTPSMSPIDGKSFLRWKIGLGKGEGDPVDLNGFVSMETRVGLEGVTSMDISGIIGVGVRARVSWGGVTLTGFTNMDPISTSLIGVVFRPPL